MSWRLPWMLAWVACSGGTPTATDAPTPLVCPADTCGATCTDVDADPFNCGDCGITCVVQHAEPTCDLGECALGSCIIGWADCDGDPGSGCEAESLCVDGASCATTCGSSGTQDCTDPCAPVCTPPEESCNLVDDDCDGTCDEDLSGCRDNVYRSHGPVGHMYGLEIEEAVLIGQSIESARYFSVMAQAVDGTRPLYRCDKGGGRRFLTMSSTCEGLERPPELTLGFIAQTPVCGAVPLYRLFSATATNHFYTTSSTERDRAGDLGYRQEGIVGYVWEAR